MRIPQLSYDLFSLPTLPLPKVLYGWRPEKLRSTLALSAKVALDRTASALRFAVSHTPSHVEWLRIVAETSQARDLWTHEGWFDKPETYHVNPPPLRNVTQRRAQSHGIDFKSLSFHSGYEPNANEPGRSRWLAYRTNRTAFASVFRHPGPPRPWLICIHGYGLGFPFFDMEMFRVAWLYRELGLNVILPVLPFHGPRRIGWQSGEGFFGGDILDTIHAEAQAVWDVRRLLTWIRSQDPVGVGIYGLSLGGYNAALVAALDADLACVIAGIPATDFVRLAQHHCRPADLLLAKQAGLVWSNVRALMGVVSPLRLAPSVEHGRRFIFGGRRDFIVLPDQVRDLCKHWQHPRVAWYDGSHLSFPWEPAVSALLNDALRTTLLAGEQERERTAA